MKKLTDAKIAAIKEDFGKTGLIRATAKKHGISRKTMRKLIRNAFVLPPRAPRTDRRPSKLDPYKPKIAYLVREKKLSAVRVMEEIQDLGYKGGYSNLKNHIRTIRPKAIRRPTPPIDHLPGHEGQMDWSPHRVIIAGRETMVHTASFVLCYSRWLFVRHYIDETLENVIDFHQAAFKKLNAVPRTVTYDNMTTVGFHKDLIEVWHNPRFKRYAEQIGFEPIILPPGSKERHGAVERPFHYIEHNFLAGREFCNWDDLNKRSEVWQDTKANVRIHGTLRERPVDRLIRERPYLLPLASAAPQIHIKELKRLIHADFCVRVDRCLYSANPDRIGVFATVRLFKDYLEIWIDGKFDCRHKYAQTKGQRMVLPEHQQYYKSITGQRRLLEEAVLRLGEPARAYYEGLQKVKKAATGYHLKRILNYAERYGVDIVVGAMAYATKFGAFGADALLRIIQGKRIKKYPNAIEDMPDNIRQFLEAYVVETEASNFYDQLIQNHDDSDPCSNNQHEN